MPWSISIDNLYPDVDVSKLCSTFGKFGRIVSANIDYDRNLLSLRKGHVSFDNELSAFNAFSEMDGEKIIGKPMMVAMERNENIPESVYMEYYTKIFVKNIDLSWDELDLIKAFTVFGEIGDAQISMREGRSNGYGFVIFKKHSFAKEAIKTMNGKKFCEKKLVVQPFIPKDLREKSKHVSAQALLEKSVQLNNLHVKNIPKDTTEVDLIELFKEFGKIQSVKVARDEVLQSKGFGFVCFYDERDARRARDRMNRCSYNSRILEVNFNQKKAARQKYLEKMNSGKEFQGGDNSSDGVESPPPNSKNASKSNIFSFSGKRY